MLAIDLPTVLYVICYVVYSVHIRPKLRPENIGSGHMRRKLPKAEVLGSYIRGIHHVTMIHVIYTLIAWYEDAIFTKWCICNIYRLRQHRAMATISVYITYSHPYMVQCV